jgi:hypothetical protein
MPLASGGSGRLDRLCLPAGAVSRLFVYAVSSQQSAVSKTRKKNY